MTQLDTAQKLSTNSLPLPNSLKVCFIQPCSGQSSQPPHSAHLPHIYSTRSLTQFSTRTLFSTNDTFNLTQLTPLPSAQPDLIKQPNLIQRNKTELTLAQLYPAQSKSAEPRLALHCPVIPTQFKTTQSILNQPNLTQLGSTKVF